MHAQAEHRENNIDLQIDKIAGKTIKEMGECW